MSARPARSVIVATKVGCGSPLVLIACSSEWPHVLKLFLRRLQPLAQALDVFIVRLVLLLVHFQQRPQDLDAMLFLHHTLSVFKLAYDRTVSDCFDRFTGFYICVWLNVVLGVGWLLKSHPKRPCCAFPNVRIPAVLLTPRLSLPLKPK